MSLDDQFRRLTAAEYETLLKGQPPVDIYVYLSTSKKHLVFVEAGVALSEAKLESLKRLGVQNLFVREAAAVAAPAPKRVDAIAVELDPKQAFEGEVLGPQAETKLKECYRSLLELPPEQAAIPVSEVVSKMSDQLIQALAPEAKDIRSTVIKNLSNVRFMSHSAALSTIAVLCAVANDFRSKTVFQTLLNATLLMDASLADLEEAYLETYYRNRRELPSHVLERIQAHPVKSQQMVAYLPIHTDALSQLILNHHELHNGRGYHRGIRTAQILPLARVLALAVDFYEQLKSAELNGQPLSLKDVLVRLRESGVEPHERRHQTKLVEGIFAFLGMKL